MGDPEHEMLEPCLQPFVNRLGAQASDVGRTLDLAWIPANAATPLIEHRGQVRVLVRRADRVPHLGVRSEEHTSELQSRVDLVCRLLLEKKNHVTMESNISTKASFAPVP